MSQVTKLGPGGYPIAVGFVSTSASINLASNVGTAVVNSFVAEVAPADLVAVSGTGAAAEIVANVRALAAAGTASGYAGTLDVAISTSPSIAAVEGAGAIDEVIAGIAVAQSGIHCSGAVATVVANVRPPLSAAPMVGDFGALALEIDEPAESLPAVHATATAGRLSAAIGKAATATSASGRVGSPVKKIAITAPGVHATGSVGDIAFGTRKSLSGVHATGARGIIYAEQPLHSGRGVAAIDIFGIALRHGISGTFATGRLGNLTASTVGGHALSPAFATGKSTQFGITIDVSAGKTHGKGKGHGKSSGNLRIELDSAVARGLATYPGFVAQSQNGVSEGIIGVKSDGIAAELDFTIDSDALVVSVSGVGSSGDLAAASDLALDNTPAAANFGTVSIQIDPEVSLQSVAATSVTKPLTVDIAETAETDAGIASVAGIAIASNFGIAVRRELQQGVNQAVGEVEAIGDSVEISLAAAAATGIAGSLLSEIEIGVSAVPAIGSVADLASTIQIFVPICNMNMQIRTGDCNASLNTGNLNLAMTYNSIIAAMQTGALKSQLQTGSLRQTIRCE